jgi:beta-lactamase regulating signal transducer with metallopeptidase domain
MALFQSAFLKALGWALLNSIWQMAILWLVFLVLTASLRKLTSHIKHSLAVLLLGVGSVWFAVTLAVKYFSYSESPLIITSTEEAPETFAGMIGLSLQNLEAALPFLSSIYLAAIVFLFFRFLLQYRYTRHVSTHAVQKLQPQLRLYVQQIAARMGIKKDIKVWLSEIVDTPMTIGFWKPVILMPIASLNGLSTQQVEAILLHELAHIRRNDYLVNLVISSIDIILFFNPFSRLFIRTIKRERENSCDDLVLQFQYNAHAYASALLVIEQKRILNVSSLAIAATGKNNRMLLDRVKRILNQPVAPRYNNRMVAHLFAGALIAFIAWSNPGNVIVKKILNPQPAEVGSLARENKDAVFVSAPIASTDVKLKIKKAQHKKLQELTSEEIASEAEMALNDMFTQVAFENREYVPQLIQASNEILRDFSIAEPTLVEKPIEAVISVAPMPYVPSTSFSYYFQDSSKPGLTALSAQEMAANEALKKTLKALEEIDWAKLEKELKANGGKIDMQKLQEEIKKSLQQVDWEKLNVESKLEQMQIEAKKRQDAYLRELTKAKNNAQMQEHYKNLQKKVVEDQIKCNQQILEKEQELKEHLKKNKQNTTTTVRKIVYI